MNMATQKLYTNFVNKKPWVAPSFVREGPQAPLVPGVNSSALFGYEYSKDASNKARINQSTVSNNKNNTALNPDNKSGDIGLTDTENRNEPEFVQQGNKSVVRESYTALERGVNNLQNRVQDVDRKVETLDEGYRTVPSRIGDVETNMTARGHQVEELEWRNKVHSAKIHELERELRNVKLANDAMKGRVVGPGGLGNIPEDSYRDSDANGYYSGQNTQRYDRDPYEEQVSPRGPAPAEGQGRQRRVYENEQHNIAHRHGGADGEEPYWGFNRYYNPQFVTAYRREQVPYYARLEENQQKQQMPGGLYIIRFHDTGYDEVSLSLKLQQTIIKSSNGYVLGLARKNNVIVIEGDADWHYSKVQQPRRQITVRHRNVDDALALLWFPSREKAFDFFSNSFHNNFKQQGFPTPHGWEAHFIPLLTPPFLRTLDTYLILELTNIGNNQERLRAVQEFEAEARSEVLRYMPNSMPFIASAIKGRDAFKPGPLFKDRSKVFFSRFDSMSEMAELWNKGIIQNLLQKHRLTGPINVSAFSLKDWQSI